MTEDQENLHCFKCGKWILSGHYVPGLKPNGNFGTAYLCIYCFAQYESDMIDDWENNEKD